MLLTRYWFLIAGLLLLSSTPCLAEPYLRVSKNGVVFYYFNHRETTRPGQEKKFPPKLSPETRVSKPSSPLQVLPASLLLPTRTAACDVQDTGYINADMSSSQLMPGTSLLSQVADTSGNQESSEAAKPGFLRLLTKLGFFDPPTVSSSFDGRNWLMPDLDSDDFVVRDLWHKSPKYFREPSESQNVVFSPRIQLPRYFPQPRLWGRVAPTLRGQPGLSYCFPVAQPFTFRDTWGDPRSSGRIHRAVDIFAPEGTAIYAITAGVVSNLGNSSSGGIMLFLAGHDGRGYGYMHLHSYAPGIVQGKAVQAGELIGFMGHTGTQNSADHLHLQVYPDHNFSSECLINPYDFLAQLCRGIGVTDLNQAKVDRNTLPVLRARPKSSPELKVVMKKDNEKWIKVYQRPFGEQRIQLSIQGPSTSPTLVIRKF